MSALVAHSEQDFNPAVRGLRRACAAPPRYTAAMRLLIREMRLARGWTVETLAGKVGMSRSYVSEIETGKKAANDRRIQAFADAFGVSPIDLIDDGSIDKELLRHLRRLRAMEPADRDAVLRHAMAYPLPETDQEPQ